MTPICVWFASTADLPGKLCLSKQRRAGDVINVVVGKCCQKCYSNDSDLHTWSKEVGNRTGLGFCLTSRPRGSWTRTAGTDLLIITEDVYKHNSHIIT